MLYKDNCSNYGLAIEPIAIAIIALTDGYVDSKKIIGVMVIIVEKVMRW